MNEKDQELNLEDILKEFGDSGEILSDAEDEASHSMPEYLYEEPEDAEEPQQEPDEVPAENPADLQPEEAEEQKAPVDTIRMGDVVREAVKATAKKPAAAEPVEEPVEEEAAAEEEVPAVETAEEPAQEAPEEEYVPQEPIPFRPRSRLRELKRKLIAGPEKRYYELSEAGVGKLQVAILLSMAVVILSAGAGVLYAFDMIPDNRMRLMVFCQILAMLVGALLGCYQMMDGFADLFHGRFTLNTMLCITFIACCVDSVFCLVELRVPLCAAFTLQVAMALCSTYQKRSTEMGQMDTMRKATRLDSVRKVDDFFEGRPGIARGEGQVEDFMDRYEEISDPEKAQSRYAVLSLIVSLAVAVVAAVFNSISMGIQIFSTTLLVAVPASFFVSFSRPMAILERRLHSLGTVLCGWSGVKALSGKVVYPLTDGDIFPAGSVKMNGVKFYGGRDPDEVIGYATALICINGGGLAPVFRQLLDSRNGPRFIAKNLQVYPGGGIGGEVCGESVIMGSSKFLQEMGIEIPAGTMVNQAVYVAIDGDFSGLFAVTYNRMKYSAAGMATLCAYRGVLPLITADDFMLTPAFMKEKFGVSIRRLVYPTREEKALLRKKEPAADAPVLALTTHHGLAPAAYAISGARALRTACNLGLVIHMVGGILGMLIMLALAIIGAVELLTPLNILLYQLVWMVPGLLVTEWTRAI